MRSITEEQREFVVEELVEGFKHVACNVHGICLVKTLVHSCKGKGKDLLLKNVVAHAVELSQDPYGNYAIQTVVEEWSDQIEQFIGSQNQILPKKLAQMSL